MTVSDELKDEVRAVYCFYRRAYEHTRTGKLSSYGLTPMPFWDGGYVSGGPFGRSQNRSNIWEKIAQKCIEYNLDPNTWIQAVFISWSETRVPDPNIFTSDALANEFKDVEPEMVARLDRKLKSDLREYQTCDGLLQYLYPSMSQYERAVKILMDGSYDIGPLCRYILASQGELYDIAEQYVAAASLTARLNRRLLLQTTWCKFVPQEWLA